MAGRDPVISRGPVIGEMAARHFRRSRRAFEVARRCQGAMRADQSGTCLERASTDADRVAADIFSSTIREYSPGEHVPRAIIRVRRPTVSHEENANSVIIAANDAGLLRFRLLIACRWDDVGKEQAHPASANPRTSP